MNKKQRILEIIETLALPMSPDEIKLHLDSLDEREIELLLPLYEEMVVFHTVIDFEANRVNPEINQQLDKFTNKKTISLTKEFKKVEIEEDFEYQIDMLKSEERIDEKRKTLFQQFQETALAIARYLNGDKSDELAQATN